MRFLVFVLFAISSWACSNELELNAPAKEIPIVYGLLSPSDDVHYIRVERAFIDEQTSALELAQRPESLYFDDVSVTLTNQTSDQTFNLEEVDGRQFGLERTDGIFATAPNILYRITNDEIQLQAGTSYELTIRQPNSETPLATASTTILGDLRLNRPLAVDQKSPLRILPSNDLTIVWGADETAKIFDVTMLINYEEFNPNDASLLVEKTIAWPMERSRIAVDGPNRIEPEGSEFYAFLRASIEENPNVQRIIRSVDFQIDAGGEELLNYINVGSANTGITSAQLVPTYTNLSSGLGIFASRNSILVKGFPLDNQTKEELRTNELTKDLNFR
ncbi:MAG: hypothetical protein AAF960_14395 [Bacteroidota bacterium]